MNIVNELIYFMQVYDTDQTPTPTTEYGQWVAVEVESGSEISERMEKYELKGGLYAVFIHIGLPSDFPETMNYTHKNWLPDSEYEVNFREHFETLGAKYK
ncbi:MAG: GyrI-like domain-containing protein [Spirosomataceae bacterium]